ncbi:hypothetical protein GCM10011575_00500 [Microlunatus endophyticus]|uniref:AAA domain-containing protein n=1 Tax=Microlunatus endophyticus TaxID=1716077 RepID=A0A917VYV8_9ACTN|nr:AAA family ATPase [Microlunatus endophyticus]GGL46448.1 hypothetical protein GCM10011575_00500 [Microlunatus endophyticus]
MSQTTADLILVTGPSGVGKSTVSQQIHDRLGGDWLLWQADLCQPRHHPIPTSLTPEQGLALEQRMFAANVDAIGAYLSNNWPVVAELTAMTAREADAIRRSATGRVMLVQLDCSPEALAAHLQLRDTPVPMDWAVTFYERWRGVTLPGAIRVDVTDKAPAEVVDRILHCWSGYETGRKPTTSTAGG